MKKLIENFCLSLPPVKRKISSLEQEKQYYREQMLRLEELYSAIKTRVGSPSDVSRLTIKNRALNKRVEQLEELLSD